MKKGFTIVELLVVIGLMALLAALVIPNISRTRDRILEKDREAVIKRIEIAAEDWGYKNLNEFNFGKEENGEDAIKNCTIDGKAKKCSDCYKISVFRLISEGYLVGDKKNKTILTDPVSNESMNNMEVCVRFVFNLNNGNINLSDRKMEAYLIE